MVVSFVPLGSMRFFTASISFSMSTFSFGSFFFVWSTS